MKEVGIVTLLSVAITAAAPAPQAYRPSVYVTPKTTQDFATCFTRSQDEHGFSTWAVVEKESGTVVGDVGFGIYAPTGEPELGYTLADRTGRYQEALELIDRARVAEPDNAAIVDSYGWVLYRLGRNADALVQLRRAWTLAKDPEIAAHVGEVLWVLGKHDEARHFFEEAARLDPENRALLRAREKFNP